MRPAPDAPQESDRDRPLERERWFRRGRTVKGESAAALRLRAYRQKMRLRAARAASTLTTADAVSTVAPATAAVIQTSSSGPQWTNLGPAPMISDPTGFQDYGFVSGRSTRVLVDQNDSTGNTVYVGGAFGGLWKATNAASSSPSSVVWTPLIDNQPTLAVGAIAIQPGNSNLILVGTGEPNSSTDSYYGLGVLRSTDGGASWTLITSADNGVHPFKGLGFSRIAFSTDNPSLVVAATAATNGIELGALNAQTTRGLYYSTDAGLTWQFASVMDGSLVITPGSTSSVVYHPGLHQFFAAIRFHGVYASSDGINWQRLLSQPGGTALSTSACPANTSSSCPIYRGELALRPGANDMYIWYVDASDGNRGIFTTPNASTGSSWVRIQVGGINTCGDSDGCGTIQGGYNLTLAAVPNGANIDLYAGAINIFKCTISSANSTCSLTSSWQNLTHTYGCTPQSAMAHVHPDQHDIDFSRAHPSIIYFSNDGGIYRTLNGPGLINGACSSTPNPFDNLNGTLGSMTQFVSFSVHPTDEGTLLGGTQDNGSPAIDAAHSGANGVTWTAVNSGDGGFNEINRNNPAEWFTAYTDVSIQRCTSGLGCTADTFLPVVFSSEVGGDHGSFYTPYILDPQATGNLIVGTCRVWRGPSSGLGWSSANALSNPFGGAFAPCTGGEADIVNALAAGGPVTANGSQVVYAGTFAGHVFVTTQADGGRSTWLNQTNFNSNAFPISDIALDPSDPAGKTAYLTVMGFGTGHVFKTTNAGASWTDITGDLPDAPADTIFIDPGNPSAIYVGTDVGVFTTSNGGANWTEYGPTTGPGFLPNVPVTRLRAFISGTTRKLRASTYGRGIWETDLGQGQPPTPDFSLTTGAALIAVRPGSTATYGVTVSRLGGFSSLVDLSCSGTFPAGVHCSVSPAQVDLGAASSQSATVTVTTTAATPLADTSFSLHGVQHGAALAHDLSLTLRVNDFDLSPAATQTVPQAGTASFQLTLTGHNNFSDTVTLSCQNLPAALGNCSFSNNGFTPAASGTVVTLTVPVSPTAVPGPATFTILASGGGTSHSVSATVNVVQVQDFSFTGNTVSQGVTPGSSASFSATLQPLGSFSAGIALSCSGLPAGAACSFSPASPTISGGISQPLAITVTTSAATPVGSSNISVTATGGGQSHSISLALSVQDFSLSVSPASATIPPGAGTNFTVTLASIGGFTSPVTLSCPNLPAGLTCSFSANSVTPSSSVTATVLTSSSSSGTLSVTISGAAGSLTHSQQVSVTTSTAIASFTETLSTSSVSAATGSSASFTVSLRASGFTSVTVLMSCAAPLPPGVSCSFSPSSVTVSLFSPATVNATVFTSSNTPPGAYALAIQGATSNQLKQSTLTLNVTDFALNVQPSSATISTAGGGSANYTVSLSAINGFNASVNLSCAGLPTGASCSFSPASLVPAGNSTLTLTTTASAPSGPFNFTVQGSGGGVTHSKTVQVINGQDFALNAAPSTVSVPPGGNGLTAIGVTTIGSFTSPVTLSCTGVTPAPASGSLTCTSFSVNPVAPPGNSSLQIAASASLAPGSYTLTVQGTGGSLTHSTGVTVNVPDYSLALSPSSQSALAGNAPSFTGTATSIAGFSSAVNLSCSVSPAASGVTCGLPGSVVPTSPASTFAVNLQVSGAATLGSYTVTVSGNDGAGHVHQAQATLLVQDFSVAATNTSPSVEAGSSTSFSGQVLGSNGFTGSVQLSCSPASAGLVISGCVFTPNPVAASPGGAAFTVQVTVDPTSVPGGPYTLKLTGTSGGVQHSANVTITVTPTNDFSLAVTPPSATVNAGNTSTFNLTLTSINNFTSAVTITCSVAGAPAGLTCTPASSSLTPAPGGTASSVPVQTTSGVTPAGAYSITITASGGGKSHSQTVSLTIKDFSISVTPASQTVNPGSSANYTVSMSSPGGFSNNAALSCAISSSPAGASCDFDSASLSVGGSTTLHLLSTASTPSGTYTVTVTATAGSTVHQQSVTLVVGQPDFTFTTSTPSLIIGRNQTGNYLVTVTAQGTFNSSVSFTCSGLPSLATCVPPTSFVPSAGGTNTTVGVKIFFFFMSGTYNFQLVATGGGQVHSIPVSFTVN